MIAPVSPRLDIRMPSWLVLNVGALSSSFAHTLVDHHLGLYGESSSSMSPLQATNVALTCLVVAWWIICLAATAGTGQPGLSGALSLALVWAFLANGFGGSRGRAAASRRFPLPGRDPSVERSVRRPGHLHDLAAAQAQPHGLELDMGRHRDPADDGPLRRTGSPKRAEPVTALSQHVLSSTLAVGAG